MLRQWGDYIVDEVIYVTFGDTMLEFIGVTNPSSTKHDTWGVGYRMIALEVDDMDAAVTYLKSKGIELTTGPAVLGTSKRAEIVDPDGLPIELRQW
ncbi:MAG: VOC family protein [Actinobacteria bacterium]|nr:VOC family protein [Actinomycetota bacterium]